MTVTTLSYFVYATEQANESADGSWSDLSTAVAQANAMFPGGQWIIKDSFRSLVQRWDGSTS